MAASLSHPPLLTSIKIPSTLLLPILSPLDRFPLSFPSLFPSHLLWAPQPPPCAAPPCDHLTAPKSSLRATTSNFPFDSLIIRRHSPRSKSNPVEPLIAYLPRSPTLLHSAKGAILEPRVPRSLDHTIKRPPSLAHAALSRIHLVAQ